MVPVKLKVLTGLCLLIPSVFAKTYLMNEGRNHENSIRLDSAQKGRMNIEFYIGSFEADPSQYTNDYLENTEDLKFQHFELSDEAGLAALPYKSFIVSQEKSNLEVNLKYLTPKLFKGLYAQVAATKPCRCDKSEPIRYELKNDYYNEEAPIYRLESLGTYRGRPMTKVYIYGARQTKEGLMVYPSMKLSLESKDDSKVEIASLDFKEANKKFLVITAQHLGNSANAFSAFKEAQGYEVDQYFYEDVASSPEELRDFIKREYQKHEYQYAVLVGNERLIPTFYRETSMAWNTPTDYPYFYLDETDQQFDFFPEIFYGRLTGDRDEDILSQVEKLKEQFNESWEDARGLNQVMGIASNEGVNPSDEEYVESMLAPLENKLGKKSTYYFQKNRDSNVENITDTFNEGLLWMNYIGHGSGTSWPSINQDQFQSSDIDGLVPGKVKPVIIDVACQNGRFNQEGRLGESFMISTQSGAPIGALAYFGGSVDISWDPPAIMAEGIGESFGTNPARSLYAHIMNGQEHLLNTYSDIDQAKENLVWYHLLGDPSLRVKP